MTRRKTLKELTIKDNFMFGAVMCEESNCKRLLELVLGFSIERVKVSKEKSIIYHPEYKGVRLDVYAKDEKNTHYNVEMQAVAHAFLGKRSRYYHSQMDMDLLGSGREYEELPNTYIIFICDFDPFGARKYRYTFKHTCQEAPNVQLQDGSQTIFLSTKGRNPEEVPAELVKFLKYVQADLEESTSNYDDAFIESLQKAVHEIKQIRGMEEKYMLTELLMRDERKAGRIEGLRESILEVLLETGTVPSALQDTILQTNDLAQLRMWVKLAAKVDSIEQFMDKM